MKIGIVGLPNTGKSTLFNAMTGANVVTADYSYSTVEPNMGVVSVRDTRLDYLKDMYDPKKVTPATIEFVDIAGLPEGASKGEGLGNKFLSHIREVDAILHVVRCFKTPESEEIDPIRDIEIVELELVLADIEIVERRYLKTEKASKGDKKLLPEVDFLKRLSELLQNGRNAREMVTSNQHEEDILNEMPLLSLKPVIFVANLPDDSFWDMSDGDSLLLKQIENYANSSGAAAIAVSALAEQEIARLDEDERNTFLSDLKRQRGLDILINESYKLLGLISFLTAGKPEVRAWTIKEGMRAKQAAGKIHSDLERGFIRAEIVAFDDLKSCGSMTSAKEKGLVRIEGKDYIMKDGDITLIRFNV